MAGRVLGDLTTQLGGLAKNRAPAFSDLKNLIIVPGHAIWLGGASLGMNDTEWNLAKGREGEGKTYVKHIEAGIQEALKDQSSLLVFSGYVYNLCLGISSNITSGETDPRAGPRSEAQSYFDLAHARGLIPQTLLQRVTTEFIALDSYQNLLFSIARFHEYTKNYPEKITIVSHAFKKERFSSLHLKAIHYPLARVNYIGIDPPSAAEPATRELLLDGENKNGLLPWGKDPYACDEAGPLVAKRKQRGWSRRGHGYWDDCVELRDLLSWCDVRGDRTWIEGTLPWDK